LFETRCFLNPRERFADRAAENSLVTIAATRRYTTMIGDENLAGPIVGQRHLPRPIGPPTEKKILANETIAASTNGAVRLLLSMHRSLPTIQTGSRRRRILWS